MQSKAKAIYSADTLFLNLINGIIRRHIWRQNKFHCCGCFLKPLLRFHYLLAGKENFIFPNSVLNSCSLVTDVDAWTSVSCFFSCFWPLHICTRDLFHIFSTSVRLQRSVVAGLRASPQGGSCLLDILSLTTTTWGAPGQLRSTLAILSGNDAVTGYCTLYHGLYYCIHIL